MSASWSSVPSLQAPAFCRQAARGDGDGFSMAALFISDHLTSEGSQKQAETLVGLAGNPTSACLGSANIVLALRNIYTACSEQLGCCSAGKSFVPVSSDAFLTCKALQ